MLNEELVIQIQNGVDPNKCLEQLYFQNEKFIWSIVWKYRRVFEAPYGCDAVIEKEELMNEAYFGLVKAAYGFEPAAGNTFLTYAAFWIRQAIQRFIENSGEVVRVPIHIQQKIYQYNQVSRHYLFKFGREPSINELATCLYMTIKQVDKLQQFMVQRSVLSLDVPISDEADSEETYIDTVANNVNIEQKVIDSMAAEQIQNELWGVVEKVLKNDTMIEILRYRHVEGLSLEQTGERLGMQRESVRNLENKALRRLKSNSKTKRLYELVA
jgi:RNA polymerase primary sigma factor